MDKRIVCLKKALHEFGGYRELARRLKVPSSTCHGWGRRNKLPPWRAKDIAKLAKRTKKDVFKSPPARASADVR